MSVLPSKNRQHGVWCKPKVHLHRQKINSLKGSHSWVFNRLHLFPVNKCLFLTLSVTYYHFLGCLKLAKQVLELPPAINMSCHSFLWERHMTLAIWSMTVKPGIIIVIHKAWVKISKVVSELAVDIFSRCLWFLQLLAYQ